MIPARRLAALALLGPMTATGLVLAAGPAYAAGISSPGNGVTYAADTTVRIRADISTTTRTELRLKSPVPNSAEQVVDSGQGTLTDNNAALAYDLDTACATYPSPSCSGRAPAPNGVWTIRLTGGATDSSTFVLRIAPRAPASVAAQASGSRAVVVSWRKGDEPDLVGWTLFGEGGVLQERIGLDACSGTNCSTTVTYASDGTGQHTYSLIAKRSTAPGSAETVDSPRSAEASATLQAPPPPPPSPAAQPTGGPDGGSTSGSAPSGGTTGSTGSTGSGGSAGGAGPGGTTGPTGTTTASGPTASRGITTSTKPAAAIAQRRAFALTFKAFGPKLGIPKLPPLPATQPAVASALPDGTFEPTLGYKEIVTREKVSTPKAAAEKVTGAVGSALDSEQFVRSLAGALILLLAAAHLRRWLGSHTET